MVGSFNRSMSGHFSRKNMSFGSPRVGGHRKSWVSRWFHILVGFCLFISFLLAISCGYLYVFPSLSLAFHGGYGMISTSFDPPHTDTTTTCDFFEGRWVPYNGYPLYNSSECPFTERGFNCLANGRKDRDYLNWRWKPNDCDVPMFDVHVILEKLRGKRIVFVGDSMSRTQWESLICWLMTGVEDKKTIYEVNGNNITKQIRFLGVRFSSFNFTIDFFRSVFLVQHGWVPRQHGPKRVRSTLKLDKLDDISKDWIDADVLIFNTGQWWTPGKLFDTGCYFQIGKSLKLGMTITTAYRIALETWASWVETMININRTQIFFRTFEPSHWSDQPRRFCNVTQLPMSETQGRDQSPLTDIISEVVKNMTVPVTVLRVTSMGAFRSDAHVGTWSDTRSVPDCSHWCLPGVPDVWNEIIMSYLLSKDGVSIL